MVKPEIVFLTIGNHSEQEGVMLSPDDGTLLISEGTHLPYRLPIYSRCGFIPLSRKAGRFANRTVSKNLKNIANTAKVLFPKFVVYDTRI